MQTTNDAPLAPMTTLHVGGTADRLVETGTTEEFAAAVREAERENAPLLVLGGGSNTLVCDEGWRGTVVRPRQDAVELLAQAGPDDAHDALVRCEAGAHWDGVVSFAVSHGLAGAEALSGIPGMIGSGVMQNIGAYGQELGESLVSVLLLDRATGEQVEMGADELGLGYRTSMLRRSMEAPSGGKTWRPTPRWVVLESTFGFARSERGKVRHAQLAQALGVEVGAEMPVTAIRETVLSVRGHKAMLEDDPAAQSPDHDRWSSGSFFTNPVLNDAQARSLPQDAPRYPAEDGRVKTSAAWLIEHAGFSKGYGTAGDDSRATLSRQHCLALTNRGHATAEDVLELARTVRCGVFDKFGILLAPETVLVGCEL